MDADKEAIRYFTITFCFKVLDSDMFGGKGSTGYASTGLGFKNELKGNPADAVDDFRKNTAKMLEVKLENVISVSKEEYEENTED